MSADAHDEWVALTLDLLRQGARLEDLISSVCRELRRPGVKEPPLPAKPPPSKPKPKPEPAPVSHAEKLRRTARSMTILNVPYLTRAAKPRLI